MIRLSTTTYDWEVFTDPDHTIPYNDVGTLTGLVIIAKKKASDADADAVFTITQNAMSISGNTITFTITSAMTASLPVNKDTTIVLELVKTDAPRQTIGEPIAVSVYRTYKDA